MNIQSFNKKVKAKLVWLTAISAPLLLGGAGSVLFTACSDTWDDHYDNKGTMAKEGSLWQVIKQDANLSNFATVIEGCGYDKSLASSQVFTVFAPTNDHFSSAEAAELVQAYNQEKGKVNDEDNTVIKEFLQKHIALFKHSVSASSNDSLVMMNGKYAILTHDKFGGQNILSSNQLCTNGVLFTIANKAEFFPNVFEYTRKDADLDSLSSFLYNSRFYRKEFQAKNSVAGDIVDGKTIYLDSVFKQQNDLFDSEFLEARIDQEDSTYMMVAPTNEVWRQLVDEYSNYFNYADNTKDRDSVAYTNTRLAIMRGTIFSRTINTDAQLRDSAMSTSACAGQYRASYWGTPISHYYQYGDGTGFSKQKPLEPGGVLADAEHIVCSNGEILKTNQWNINPLNTFYQWIVIEAENQRSLKEVSKVANSSTGEDEESVIPTARQVLSDNSFYGKVWGGNFVEFVPTRATVNPSVTFNIRNVLSNIGYDIYLVTAPALANDSNATDIQRLPTKMRCTLGFNDQSGTPQQDIIQSSIETVPDVVNYLLLAEDYKFPVCSYGLEEDEPQVTLKLETRVSSTEQRTNKFTRTMMIDCIMLVPHGMSFVEKTTDDTGLEIPTRFLVSPHGDGIVYWMPTK